MNSWNCALGQPPRSPNTGTVRNLLRLFAPLLLTPLFSSPAFSIEVQQQENCSSIAHILANAHACDKRTVRVAGKIIDIKDSGKQYTEFTLSDGAKKMTFFSFDRIQLEKGACVQIEGKYCRQRNFGSSTCLESRDGSPIVRNQVVVEKGSEGVNLSPCGASPPGNGEAPRPAPTTLYPPSSAIWGLAALFVLVLTALALWVQKKGSENRFYKMGRAFEEYVITLFPDREWELVDRSSDTSKTIGRPVTGDFSYDFIVRHRRTSRRFTIQCKYRSRFYRQGDQEGLDWAKPAQIQNYRRYQRESGCPYLGIIGVGGQPRQPDLLLVLPLERLRYPFMWKENVLGGRRDLRAPFRLDDQGVPR